MENLREVKLPSGAVLRINVSPFSVSKNLYQALLRGLKSIPLKGKNELPDVIKDCLCTGFSSPEIEACLRECFGRCTYNAGNGDLKIDDQTFEPVERREDYMRVCVEVAKDNVLPFVKSLYADFQQALSMLENIQA